jgi:nicotinate-nucleotide adenylyltransferase
MALREVGVFGGSFNPVHSGHVLLARHALEALGLHELWLVPCAESADGKALAPGALRLKWLEKALQGEQGLKASDVELRRGGVSRSVDTLRELRAGLGKGTRLTLLLGQDQAARLPGWKEAEKIPGLARIAVFRRPGFRKRSPEGFPVVPIDAPLFQISSSEIRRAIALKKNLSLLLPPALVNDASLRRAFSDLSTP